MVVSGMAHFMKITSVRICRYTNTPNLMLNNNNRQFNIVYTHNIYTHKYLYYMYMSKCVNIHI